MIEPENNNDPTKPTTEEVVSIETGQGGDTNEIIMNTNNNNEGAIDLGVSNYNIEKNSDDQNHDVSTSSIPAKLNENSTSAEPQASPADQSKDRESKVTPTTEKKKPVEAFFSLTRKKKKKNAPKIQDTGIVNYGIEQHSDSESDASSVSISQGYDLPFAMQGAYKKRDDIVDLDDLSVRTPIPTGPPEPGRVLPSAFLRNRSASTSNVSELSDENSSLVERQKREAENVGKLVQAAKQQQSFALAWFSAGNSENANALPKYIPPKKNIPPAKLKKKTSFKIPERSTGPIDLDSGDVWDGDETGDLANAEKGSKRNWEVGSFNYTTHSGTTKKRKNQNFISFGVPDDEDLTTYYQDTKCGDRIVCTIGSTQCSLLALIIVAFGVTAVIIGGTIAGINSSQNQRLPTPEPTPRTTAMPTAIPMITSMPTISSNPTRHPSSHPSMRPSTSPSTLPTLHPSPSPSISQAPSFLPSSSPSTSFSSQIFSQVGADIKLGANNSNDGFGTSISMSENGDIVAVGASFEPNETGSVTIYKLQTSSSQKIWAQMGSTIEGLYASSQTGPSIDMTRDGQTLIIGEQDPNRFAGVARVFTYDVGTEDWIQVGDAMEGEEYYDSQFGHAVAISDLASNNRMIAAVSSPLLLLGRITTYEISISEKSWTQLPSIDSFDIFVEFGNSISLSSDGSVLAVGVPEGSIDGQPFGYVQIYELDYYRYFWNQRGTDILYVGDLLNDATQSARFGESVSLSADGARVAIGAVGDSIQKHESSGSASVYEYNTSSSEYERIADPMVGKPSRGQKFGHSIAISSDGMYVAVGALLSSFDGQVHVHQYVNGMWDAAQVINGKREEQLGNDVDIALAKSSTKDQVIVAAGGPFSGVIGQGVARVYDSDINVLK